MSLPFFKCLFQKTKKLHFQTFSSNTIKKRRNFQLKLDETETENLYGLNKVQFWHKN